MEAVLEFRGRIHSLFLNMGESLHNGTKRKGRTLELSDNLIFPEWQQILKILIIHILKWQNLETLPTISVGKFGCFNSRTLRVFVATHASRQSFIMITVMP